MRAIKLIKRAERKVPETRSRIRAAARPDRSSQGVRSWVAEFKTTRRGESLIAFDSLFKDALSPSGLAEWSLYFTGILRMRDSAQTVKVKRFIL